MRIPVTIILAWVVGAASAVAFLQGRLAWFSIAHAISCALAGFAAWRHRTERNSALLGFVLWCCFPVLGIIGVPWLLWAVRPRGASGAGVMRDLLDIFDSDDEFIRALSLEVLGAKGQGEDGSSLSKMTREPLADVLRSGEISRKKKILSWLRFVREPWSIRLLKQSQADAQYEMQYLASRALSAMEQEWHDEIKIIAKRIEEEPTRVELRVQIVKLYALLYESGILSGKIGKILLRRALGYALIGLELDPRNIPLLMHVGDIHVSLGNYSEALRAYSSAAEINPNSAECRMKKAEALYYLSRFHEVSAECRSLTASSNPIPQETSARHWGGNAG